MAKPFEEFVSELNWQQVSLLLDTVQYFEDAPKYLALPSVDGERISVPLLSSTLREILDTLSEEQAFEKKRYTFCFDWMNEGQATAQEKGFVRVTLPDGKQVTQETVLADFSEV
ncbi:hypothetical protein [Brevibacillus dissolubilis]|uniref:hypothetical protein n=1 Tax=Brevibacillus dissolubilis TaxID=1844116 RepID=UPI001116D32C|nr:hypothetical protein [Brevibacillus dissolubilis]